MCNDGRWTTLVKNKWQVTHYFRHAYYKMTLCLIFQTVGAAFFGKQWGPYKIAIWVSSFGGSFPPPMRYGQPVVMTDYQIDFSFLSTPFRHKK